MQKGDALADGLDVLAIGSAIVDVLATAEDSFLVAQNITKASMQLVDAARAVALTAQLPDATELSGGSAANTAVGVAALGLRAGFVGRIAADRLGDVFARDIRAAGVEFSVPPATGGEPTARSIILVTPDAERSMSTFLGAAQELAAADIDPAQVEAAAITYIEGYLWDRPAPIGAVRKAIAAARAAGRRVAFTLSDPFCVERHRADFLQLLRDGAFDIVFANAHEAESLVGTADLAQMLTAMAALAPLAVVTRSAQGAVVACGSERIAVPAAPTRQVVDTTGAGDLFAAGFLAGLARQRPLRDCARMGTIAAAEVIEHYGARPQADLRARLEAEFARCA